MLTEIVKRFHTRTGYLFQIHLGLRTFSGRGGTVPEAKDNSAGRAVDDVY